ncbi:hypothetical protein ACI6Q2_20315 [Chitinophagaceae bacterium LWZ2-11]
MKKMFLILCILCITAAGLQAQKIKFNNITGVGVTTGQSTGFTAQTINGISYKSWNAGIGVGYDNYQFKNIPVFLDLRKYFGAGKIKAFIYTAGGYIMHPTFYVEPGAGIAIKVGKTNFLLSAAYCRKEFKYDDYLIYYAIDPVPMEYNNAYNSYKNNFNGLTMKFAISF